MAFPAIQDVDSKSGNVAANSASHTITYCTNIVAGDLLLLAFANDGTSNPTGWPAGWTLLGTANGAPEYNIYYKIATGAETGTFVLTTTSEMSCFTMYRISAASWHGTTPPEVGALGIATSANPDPGALTPSWGAADTLWIAVMAYDVGTITVTAYPTNYTNGANERSNNAAGVGLGIARRELNAASEDPGTYTISASSAYRAAVVAVRPAGGASGTGTITLVLTASGVATALASGSLAQSLFAVSLAASGTAPISGSLAASLASIVATGTGVVPVSGTGVPTLASVALAGAGTVTYPPISGAGTPALGAITATGAATALVSGAGSPPLATVAVSGTGTSTISASGPPLFATVSLVATGTAGDPVIAGEGSPALPPIAAAGTSTSSISGALSKPLFVVGLSSAAVTPIVAQGTRPLLTIAVSGVGSAAVAGSGAAFLANWLLTGAGAAAVRGSGVAAFPNLGAVGATSTLISGSGSPNFTLVGSGTGLSGSALVVGSPTLLVLSGYGTALALFIRLTPREQARNWGPLVEWSYARRRRILRRRS